MEESIVRAFDNIGPDNPLNRMGAADRAVLWSLLKIYVSMKAAPSGTAIRLAENAAKTAADAARLAARIESTFLQGPLSDALRPLMSEYENLPDRLRRFSMQAELVVSQVGKPGHKGKTLTNMFLAMASEFVRARTGSPNDEHLAELLQAVSDAPEDFSGDAIRKAREHARKSYSVFYESMVHKVK